jgi:hypothetical protein
MRSNMPLTLLMRLDDAPAHICGVAEAPKTASAGVGNMQEPEAAVDKSSPGLTGQTSPNFLKERSLNSRASSPLTSSAPGPRMEVQARTVSAALATAIP